MRARIPLPVVADADRDEDASASGVITAHITAERRNLWRVTVSARWAALRLHCMAVTICRRVCMCACLNISAHSNATAAAELLLQLVAVWSAVIDWCTTGYQPVHHHQHAATPVGATTDISEPSRRDRYIQMSTRDRIQHGSCPVLHPHFGVTELWRRIWT